MIRRRTVLASALAACAPGVASAASPRTGPPLPPALGELESLALTRPNGAATTLGAHLVPAPSAISFWASWCGPCVGEARYLTRLRGRTPAERLNIIGINLDDEPREEREIARFLSQVNANYMQLRGDLQTFRAFDRSPTLALPRLYIFGADGAPSAAFGGYAGATLDFDRAIERVMASAT